jgi:hypothetical protein
MFTANCQVFTRKRACALTVLEKFQKDCPNHLPYQQKNGIIIMYDYERPLAKVCAFSADVHLHEDAWKN